MNIKQRIEQDLKAALLGGDKQKTTVLRGLKSVILNAEIAQGVREQGLEEAAVIELLKKEVKSRIESAELYEKGNSEDRAAQELEEKSIIEVYLPAQLSDEELERLVDEAIAAVKPENMQAMGQVIGMVKQKAGGSADGARVAQLVKQKLEE